MVAEFDYCGLSRQFRPSRRERSGAYAIDEQGENDRQDAVRKESNHFKTASNLPLAAAGTAKIP